MADDSQQHSPPRAATRAPVDLTVRLQFDDSMEIVDAHCNNISIGGMFVDRVGASRPAGTLVRFELQIEDDSSIRGLSEVVWMRPRDGGAMGLKFRFLEQRDRQQIFKLVSQHIKERLAQRHPSLEDDDDTASGLGAGGASVRGATLAEVMTPPEPTGPRPVPVPPAAPSPAAPSPAAPSPGAPSSTSPAGSQERAQEALDSIDQALDGGVSSAAPRPAFGMRPTAGQADLGFGVDADAANDTDETGARTSLFEAGASQRPAVFDGDDGVFDDGVFDDGVFDDGVSDDGTVGPSAAGPSGAEAYDMSWDDAPSEARAGARSSAPSTAGRRGGGRRKPLLLAAVAALVLALALYLASGWLGGDEPVEAAVDESALPADASPGGRDAASTPSEALETARSADAASDEAEPRGAAETAPPAQPVAVEEPPPRAAPPPPPPTSSPARAFGRVTGIDSQTRGGAQVIIIRTDGAVPGDRFDHFRLDGGTGPREVVRLYGLSRRFDRNSVAVDGPAVRQIRTGWHEARSRGNELHVVLDLVGPAWRVTRLEPVGDRLEVTVER